MKMELEHPEDVGEGVGVQGTLETEDETEALLDVQPLELESGDEDSQTHTHVHTYTHISLLSSDHFAIPAAYFSLGLCQSLLYTPMGVYMVKELRAEPQLQNTCNILVTLPWTLKLVFGFLSDMVPIFGMHRKPYLVIGYLTYCLCLLSYASLAHPNINMLAAMAFFSTIGLIMGDVMADTMVVERSKFEDPEFHGRMQSSCYATRFAGSVIGSFMGALCYNKQQWGWGLTFPQLCVFLGLIPACTVLPFVWFLKESIDPNSSAGSKSVHQQIKDIWETVQLKAVWRPMTFVYLFNMMQIPNVAWGSFLQLSLGFKPWILGLMTCLGSLMTFLGVMAYKRFFIRSSWRAVYAWSAAIMTFFSVLQLMLIFRINLWVGLSDSVFALGDDVVAAYVSGIQFLPTCLMYMHLCPHGSEGASYAMLTTFSNMAMVCASNLGTFAASIWDVSNNTLEEHNYSGLWRLTLLTSLIQLSPMPLLFLLPRDTAEQDELKSRGERSVLGGAVFLAVLGGSLCWTIAESLATLTQA